MGTTRHQWRLTRSRPGGGGNINSPNIDITFDFRSDTPSGRDPDTFSPTLRSYHKHLWGRTLPSGHNFDLDDSGPATKRYLLHSSHLGDFNLSSDSVIPTFTLWNRMQPTVSGLLAFVARARARVVVFAGGLVVPVDAWELACRLALGNEALRA